MWNTTEIRQKTHGKNYVLQNQTFKEKPENVPTNTGKSYAQTFSKRATWVTSGKCTRKSESSQERHVDEQLGETISQLAEMTKLDIPPTEEELAIAIEELASRKAPGNDNEEEEGG